MDDRIYPSQIQSITAPQWKDLCRELGIKQMGRKDELQHRVLTHLQSEEGSHRSLQGSGSLLLRNILQVLNLPQPVCRTPPVVSDPGLICICGGSGQSAVLQCTRCRSSQHRACVGKASFMREYECPLCQLRQMEPFEQVIDVVLYPTLCQTLGGGSAQRQFVYTQEMHAKLLEPGKRRMVQIRCIRLDTEGFVQHWPKDCSILVNGRAIFSLTQPPVSCPRKRKDSPLNITNLSPGSNNQAMVMKQREEDGYAFCIFIVEVLNTESVFNRFLYERVLSPEAGQAFVRSRTCGSEDVTPDASRQSLKCPLTRLLPEVPVRGWKCQHVQCFDLYAYLVMQEKTKTNKWHCPICFSMVLHIVVDKYIQSILEQAKDVSGCEAVEFQPNGLYRLITEEKEDESDGEEDSSGHKRPGAQLDDTPVKKIKVEVTCKKQLVWGDFVQGIGYVAKASPEVLYTTLCYQSALNFRLTGVKQSSSNPGSIPNSEFVSNSQPGMDYGKSVNLPIEIDD